MSLDVLNPLIIIKHKPKGGFCLIKSDYIDNSKYAPVYNDFGLGTSSWSQLNGHGPIKNTASAVYNGNLYNFGGVVAGSTPVTQSGYYTPGSNSWTMFAGDSTARMGHMVVYDPTYSNFMSFGGNTGSGATTTVRSAPVSSPSLWNNISSITGNPTYLPMPVARLNLSGGIWNGKVYCWGGGASYLSVYTLATNAWTNNVATTPTAVALPVDIDTDNGIMYQAGWLSGETTMSIWSCILGSGTGQYVWNKLTCNTSKPALRYNHTLTYSNGILYMIGGRLYNSPGTVVDEIWAYNIAYNVWIKLTMDNLKVGTEYAAAEVLQGKIYSIGGNINSGTIVSNHHSYDLSKNYGMAIRLIRT